MSNIIGTVLSIGDFLMNKTTPVSIGQDEPHNVFFLTMNRKYIIPDYQREIRWKRENLIELISDISRGDKFLGNVILNRRTALEYEVIDGQQRITVLLMIIYYIRSRFSREINIFETCKLEMVNFDKFNLFLENNFIINNLSPEIEIQLEKSDIFNQRKHYNSLWNEFANIEILRTAANCDAFLTNIKRSQINLIINTNDTDNFSIDLFFRRKFKRC